MSGMKDKIYQVPQQERWRWPYTTQMEQPEHNKNNHY